jgi:primosomal protein N'
MYILSIIPIQRGIPFNVLSYYNTDALSVGTLVEIPFGKQTMCGLVHECTSLIEAKTSIKQATFSLKRIKKVLGISSYSKALVEGLHEASAKTLTPIGSLAGAVINELFIDVIQQPHIYEVLPIELRAPLLSYGSHLDRIDSYKRIIRTAFAQKKSVVLVAPSIRAVEYWYTTLQKGITSHSVLIHSKRTKRDQKIALTAIKSSDRPLFICTTPQSAIIPRTDITTMILEDEASPLYKLHDRYGADMRIVLECIAKASGIQMVYGDTLPRFETLEKAGGSHVPRSFTPEKLVVVPTEPYRTILPSETVELLRYCQKNKKSLLLYTNRKGIAPISRCADCGTTVDCPTCGLPIVLRYKIINGERERLFVCTHCGDTLPPTHVCTYCASWNITPVSIGTESIRDAVVDIVGSDYVITVDDDLTPDTKELETLIADTQKHKWFVMVGTQKLLPYIKQVDFIVIPFFDRLLSIPSPFTVEEVLRLLMECNEKTKDSLIICTKKPDFSITTLLAQKKIQELIESDIEARRALSYPPFGILMKLSVTVPSAHKDAVMQKVTDFFEGLDMTLLPIRRITPESMKLLCVWIIQANNDYTLDYGDELQGFLQDLRFPNTIDINPTRLS